MKSRGQLLVFSEGQKKRSFAGEKPNNINITSEFEIHKTENRRLIYQLSWKREDTEAWKTGEKN
jgi:hypothetical protein